MIKLKEIFHILNQNQENDLTDLDNWKITDYDFMEDMGFKPSGKSHFSLTKPEITVCHKKGVGFIVKDKTKGEEYEFPNFSEMSEFFAKYDQKWENAPYT